LTISNLANFADGLFTYWQFDAPGYVPTLNWMTPPPVRGGNDGRLHVPSAALSVLPFVDITQYGLVGVYQLACNRVAGPGVTLEVVYSESGGSPPRYVYASGTQPDVTRTETDSLGFVYAFNVTPGPVLVRTRIGKDGAVISEQPALVRAGWATFFSLTPTPLK
jgi:hypothetical protein